MVPVRQARAAREFGEPRSPRSPKLPPLVFEAQTCAKDSTYVGVDVVRCRRNGLANAPFPLPILCPADGEAVLPEPVAVRGARLVPEGFAGRWDHIVLGISVRSHVDAATLRRALAHGRRVARRSTWPSSA